MNPTTVVHLEEEAYMEMETTQIKGVDSTLRCTQADAGPRRHSDHQGEGHDPRQAARQVRLHRGPERRGLPHQRDLPALWPGTTPSRPLWPASTATAQCYGHSECDAIIMDNGVVAAIPEVTANCVDAQLVHEAAIGKIAGEQLIKLQTLGLTERGGRGADRQRIPQVKKFDHIA